MSEEGLSYREKLALIRQGLHPKTTGPKEKKPISKKSAKKLQQEKDEKAAGVRPPGKFELDKWFDDIKREYFDDGEGRGATCMECKAYISSLYARHATAHLLPKKLFKSVATHPLNFLILGAGCGCHEKTHRVDKFVQMKVWPEAARRIKEMIPLLPFDELKHLSSQLMTALDNTP